MTKLKLEQDELELLASYEQDEWKSAKTVKEQIEKYRVYARATFKKDKRVNIRISSKDLMNLQKRAIREGVPYQTLIASVLHKYASGGMVEK